MSVYSVSVRKGDVHPIGRLRSRVMQDERVRICEHDLFARMPGSKRNRRLILNHGAAGG
jgi:hypothetical protein